MYEVSLVAVRNSTVHCNNETTRKTVFKYFIDKKLWSQNCGGIAHDWLPDLARHSCRGKQKFPEFVALSCQAGVMTLNEGKIYKDMELFRISQQFRSD